MEVKAVAKYIKVQPRKVRIVADEVRGKSAVYTAHLLRFHPSKGARVLRKVLVSAIANAVNNHNLPQETLKIATIQVDEGPRMKRIQPRAMGRAYRILKKTSHITVGVEVDEKAGEAQVKPHGTKAKARPTFAAPAKGKGKAKKSEAKAEETKAEAAAPVEEETVAEAAAVEQAEEATPVTASDAPEEAGSATPEETSSDSSDAAEGEQKEGE